LSVTALLLALQGYLAFSAVGGQFGIDSQREILQGIELAKAQRSSLSAEVEAYRHRIALFNPERLDPDILEERARALLAFAHPDDVIVLLDTE
jgi:cell division protein FtsB